MTTSHAIIGLWQIDELQAAGVPVRLHDASRATIAGVDVLIVSAEEAETAEFVICAPVGHFADDVRTHCLDCGAAVVHRPLAPRQPAKVCVACAARRGAPGLPDLGRRPRCS